MTAPETYHARRLREIAAEQGVTVLELRRRTGKVARLPGPAMVRPSRKQGVRA